MVSMQARATGLLPHVATRLAYSIPLFIAVIVVNFVLIHLSPGDPVSTLIGEGTQASEKFVNEVRQSYGLDRPLVEQLLRYVWKAATGDLGYSFYYREPVFSVIAARVWPTLLLMGTALIFSSLLAVVLGVASALRPYSLLDQIVTVTGLIGYSLPAFWLGILFMMAFSLKIQAFPMGGIESLRYELVGFSRALDVAWHLVLPAVTLSAVLIPIVMRMARASMLDVLRMDFIATARAKGLRNRTVILKHALRNAMLPVITVIGFNFGYLLAGAALIETVFSWPGIGRLLLEAIRARDTPVILGVLLVASLGVVVANLITDVVYGFLDPRIREA